MKKQDKDQERPSNVDFTIRPLPRRELQWLKGAGNTCDGTAPSSQVVDICGPCACPIDDLCC